MLIKHTYLSTLLAAHLIFSGCAQTAVPDISLDRAALKLANGNTISEAAYDDYSPIIVRLSNGYLALVFGSTRVCSVACTNHNIFISSSVTAYDGKGILPAFNAPQPITANASPLNSSTRFQLAVAPSGNNISVYAQTTGGLISTTASINPVSAVPINVGAMLNSITEYNCYNHRMLGLDASGFMIAANTAGTLVFRFNQNTIGGGSCGSVSNTKLASASHISLMRQASTGIADAFIASDTTGNISAQTATNNGPQMAGFKGSLAREGLVATGVSVFQATTEAGDLATFSAAPGVGQKSDLYVVTSPAPAALWLNSVAFGSQPQP